MALPTPTPTAVGAPSPTPRPTQSPGQPPLPAPTPADPQLARLQQAYSRLQAETYGLEEKVKDELVQDIIIRKELAVRGVSVSPTEVEQAIISDPSFGYTYATLPSASQPVTGTTGMAPALAQLPGISIEDAQATAKQARLSWDEFKRLIAEPRARRLKFVNILADAVETNAEQVRIRHIQLSTQDEVDKALARLQAGEEFAAVAKDISTDAKTKDQGGEMGWYPRGILSEDYGVEFENVAFTASAGVLPKQAVRTGSGFHLILVDEFANSRAITPEQLSVLQSTAFERWLANAEASTDEHKVTMQFSDDKRKWVDQYLAKLVTP